MAYAISSSIPTTASCFALLQLESDTESEPENGKSGQTAGKSQASEGRSSAIERRREKRRREKEQKQIEASELTSEMFEADLQKALLLSKLEYEEHKKTSMNNGEFSHKLEDDVHRILEREKRREQLTDCNEVDNCKSREQNQESGMKDGKTELKLELEKKDAEIQQLKNIIIQRKVKYKELKARNAQLLKMLQESEMKHKAEILQQVKELQTIQNEFTLQVTTLHAALEQGRSKEKQLQAELTKYQMLKDCEPSGRVWKKDEPPKSKKRGEKHS